MQETVSDELCAIYEREFGERLLLDSPAITIGEAAGATDTVPLAPRSATASGRSGLRRLGFQSFDDNECTVAAGDGVPIRSSVSGKDKHP